MTTIAIQNLKCHGCANTIQKGLNKIQGVFDVTVDVENSKISFNADTLDILELVKDKLNKMGYPEIDAHNSGLQKAKSYVSCAIGRISN